MLKLFVIPGVSWCNQKPRLVLVPKRSKTKDRAALLLACALVQQRPNYLKPAHMYAALVLRENKPEKVRKLLEGHGLKVEVEHPDWRESADLYRGYLEALLELGEPDDYPEAAKFDLTFDSLTPKGHERSFTDCAVFMASCYDDVTDDNCQGRECSLWEMAGHCFYLERNGHGVGFSDHWHAYARFDEAAKRAGEVFFEFTGVRRARVYVY